MAWDPMDLNADGQVDFSDCMLFNMFINPAFPGYQGPRGFGPGGEEDGADEPSPDDY